MEDGGWRMKDGARKRGLRLCHLPSSILHPPFSSPWRLGVLAAHFPLGWHGCKIAGVGLKLGCEIDLPHLSD